VLTHTYFHIHAQCNQVKAEDMFEALQNCCQTAFKGIRKCGPDFLPSQCINF